MKRISIVLVGALVSSGLLASTSASGLESTDSCEVFSKSRTVESVVERGNSVEKNIARTALAEAQGPNLSDASEDPTLRLDSCARPYYQEPAFTGPDVKPETSSIMASAPLDETFTLHSLPGAQKTIYLDFNGATVANTGWSETYGSPINAGPLSLQGDSTYSTYELQAIQTVWASVAADYESFNVDVTTEAPVASALSKESSTDPVFGITAVITQGGPIASTCHCGGVAYLGITNSSPSVLAKYSTAWVFADNLGRDPINIAEAASHELGHNLGLDHDGRGEDEYFGGVSPWAPIMGTGYGQPITQWSNGSYSGATNTENDLGVIGATFPPRPDAHPNGPSSTVPVLRDSMVTEGKITTGDVDYFQFSSSGSTTITLAPTAYRTNLDARFTVSRTDGTVVGFADPVSSRVSAEKANGMGASLTLTLPVNIATYYVRVEGSGRSGNGSVGDFPYSSYGSIGTYRIALGASGLDGPEDVSPLSFEPSSASGTIGVPFSTQLVARGGDGLYSWSANGLPSGLTISPTGQISGTPRSVGSTVVSVTVSSAEESAAAQTLTSTFTLNVANNFRWVSKSTLVSAKTKRSYKALIEVRGGLYGYSFKKVGGQLPPGVTLTTYGTSAGTGPRAVLRGKPKKPGTYKVAYLVRDKSGLSLRKVFKIVVKP